MLDTAQLAPEQRRPIRRAEYAAMGEAGLFSDERVELIDGVIVRMSPRSLLHDSLIERLNELLLPKLVGRARVRVQLAFAANDWSEPEPDLAVTPVSEARTDHPAQAHLNGGEARRRRRESRYGGSCNAATNCPKLAGDASE